MGNQGLIFFQFCQTLPNECNKNIDVLKIGVGTVGISQYSTTTYNINHYLKCLGENFVPLSRQDFIY